MLFSSLTFIFVFLPIVILAYYFINPKWKNIVLMIASIFFYAWGGVSLSAVLIISIITNYLLGLWINKTKHYSKIPLIIGVVFNLLTLGTFKYGNFIVENLNTLIVKLGGGVLNDPGIVLPLGISFFTFQAMSYLIDVYRKDAPVQKNLFYLALYISFFPQLIAGPIVRYNFLAPQLMSRKDNITNFSKGIERFIWGLIKKVVIANQFAIVANEAFSLPPDLLPQQMAWAGVICYTFQIYFDFAGYSDMAIGLGRMFGFKIPENFDYPYSTKSIREFWQHWHITLGAWFRNYLYYPLGGNRAGKYRTHFNLFIVFALCGMWHGANWNFLLWGVVHGILMINERLWFEKKVLKKTGNIVSVVYTFSMVSLAWVFFETDNLNHSLQYFKILFTGNAEFSGSNYFNAILNSEFLVIAIPAIAGSFGFFRWIFKQFDQIRHLYYSFVFGVIKNTLLVFSFFIVIVFLISDTYNPFIYFRF